MGNHAGRTRHAVRVYRLGFWSSWKKVKATSVSVDWRCLWALDLPLATLFQGHRSGSAHKDRIGRLEGAGKSTVGARLALEMDVPFIELIGGSKQAAGMSLGEIFELRGEAHYRNLERETLERVLREPGPAVIAAGIHRNGARYLEAAARMYAYRLADGIACIAS